MHYSKRNALFVFITFTSVFCVLHWSANADCSPDLLKFIYIKPCTPNSIVLPHNFSVYMDRSCSIRFKGCLHMTKRITEAKGKATVKFGRISLPIKSDFCQDAERPKKIIGKVLQAVELRCPVKPGFLCPKKSLNLASEISQMGIKGEVLDITELNHSNGEKTCIELKIALNS